MLYCLCLTGKIWIPSFISVLHRKRLNSWIHGNHQHSSSCGRKTGRFSLPIVLRSTQDLCAINSPLLDLHLFIVDWWLLSDQPVNMKKVDQQLLCVRTQKQVRKQQGALSHFFPIWNKIIYASFHTLLPWDCRHQPNPLLEVYGDKAKTDWKRSQLKEVKWKTKGESSLLERTGQILVAEGNGDIRYILLTDT